MDRGFRQHLFALFVFRLDNLIEPRFLFDNACSLEHLDLFPAERLGTEHVVSHRSQEKLLLLFLLFLVFFALHQALAHDGPPVALVISENVQIVRLFPYLVAELHFLTRSVGLFRVVQVLANDRVIDVVEDADPFELFKSLLGGVLINVRLLLEPGQLFGHSSVRLLEQGLQIGMRLLLKELHSHLEQVGSYRLQRLVHSLFLDLEDLIDAEI